MASCAGLPASLRQTVPTVKSPNARNKFFSLAQKLPYVTNLHRVLRSSARTDESRIQPEFRLQETEEKGESSSKVPQLKVSKRP